MIELVNDLKDILELFKASNIRYMILRDYNTFADLFHSKDIDIFIDRNSIKKASKILKNKKYSKPKFNSNKFPHIQFSKLYSSGIVKFDIVYDFYYGQNEYYFNIQKFFDVKFNVRNSDYNVPSEDIALITMLMHIILDKKKLTIKNKNILANMYKDYLVQQKNFAYSNVILKICDDFCNMNIEEVNSNMNYYRHMMIESKMLKKLKFKKIYLNLKQAINEFLFKVERRLRRKSIAIIGVDGAGKSTTIEQLNESFNGHSKVVYMGLKNFKIKRLNDLVPKNKIEYVEYYFLLYLEMIYRNLKNLLCNKYIIYDRYVDDIFINSYGLKKIAHTIFYHILYIQPSIKIYLYCDLQTSLERKDDISDTQKFEIMKSKYDTYYLTKQKYLAISTSDKSIDDVVDCIIDVINDKFVIL